MFFHLEEQVEEADMMDQPMKDERSRRCSRNGRKLAKKRGRQICDRVVESSYRMATCTVESVGCMSPVPDEEVPKRKSQKFLAECASAFLDDVCNEHVFMDTEEVPSGGAFPRTEGTNTECRGDRCVTVNRGPEQRRQERARRGDELVQVFVNLEDGKTVALDTIVSDKVSDIKRRVRNRWSCSVDDVYVSFEGKELKGSDEVRSCGIDDVFAVPMTHRIRGGGMHRNKISEQIRQRKDQQIYKQVNEIPRERQQESQIQKLSDDVEAEEREPVCIARRTRRSSPPRAPSKRRQTSRTSLRRNSEWDRCTLRPHPRIGHGGK